jgi:hypothetical protein
MADYPDRLWYMLPGEEIEENIKLDPVTVANLFKLPKDMIDYLWECIDVAKKKKINVKKDLAGHISHSYAIDDPQNLIIRNIFNYLNNSGSYIKNEIRRVYDKIENGRGSTNFDLEPYVKNMWVNFQKKGEFQPIHNHNGIFSFVIWMDIPYHWKDEANLPFSKTNTKFTPGGNFSFLFTDGISKTIKSHDIPMSPNLNGYCCFFPSHLAHQVYPFYTSDKDRISISGNINLKMVDVPQFQQFPFFISNPQVH